MGYNGWKICNKLVLPLLVVTILGTAVIGSSLVGMYRAIATGALPEERALENIHGSMLDLITEYDEFVLAQHDDPGARPRVLMA